jgi:hypothetical protein
MGMLMAVKAHKKRGYTNIIGFKITQRQALIKVRLSFF